MSTARTHSRAGRLALPRCLIVLCLAGIVLDGREKQLRLGDKTFRIDRNVRRRTWNLTWPIPPFPGSAAAGEPLEFVFAHRGSGQYRLELGGGQWRLLRRGGGEEEILLDTGPIPFQPGEEWGELVLKRRARRISGILGGRHLFRVFETGDGRGTAASRAPPGRTIGSVKLQAIAVEEMIFRDDFLRSGDEQAEGAWQLAGGTWRLQSSADEWRGGSPLDPMNTARSPNPFVYRGTGSPRAIALAGQPFWDDISASISVRSQGGKAGWLFAYRGPEDYYVLWWEPTGRWEEPCRFAIERIRGGKRDVLAEARFLGQREQWYRIGIDLHGGEISAGLQGSRVLQVSDPTCLGGRFGMYAAAGTVDFDDADVHPAALRPLEEPSLRNRAVSDPPSAWDWTRAGVRYRPVGKAKRGSIVLGAADWSGYRMAVTVETPADGVSRVGLVFGAGGSRRTMFLWDTDEGWRPGRQLLTFDGGETSTVGEARGGLEPGWTMRLIVDLSGKGVSIYEASAGLLLRAPRHTVEPGLLGFFVKGKGEVVFRDLVLDGPPERDWEHPVKTRIFRKDHYMLDWAAPDGQWIPAEHPGDSQSSTWWHKGDFFGALEMSLPLAAAAEPAGITAYLLALDTEPGNGYELTVEPADPGTNSLVADLRRRGKTIEKRVFSPPEAADRLTVHRDGPFIWLTCGDREPLFVQLRHGAPSGTRLGIRLPAEAYISRLGLKRSNVVDDQFEKVTTRWHKLGRWEVSNKFHCDPRWAYMVGESEGLASLWHLDSFPGDVTLEFYAGMRYRSQFAFMPYYPRPGDINAVIGSDGTTVFNGYTAIVSGWSTTWTRFLKNGEIVAETDRPLVPSTRRSYPRPQELHRKWFYVKLRRTGRLLELYFDNEKVLSWRDRDPLPGGRIGLWTVDDSILIARAKISYSRREPYRPELLPNPPEEPDTPKAKEAPPLRLVSGTHPGCRFDFDRPGSLDGWPETGNAGHAKLAWDPQGITPDGGSLRVTNADAGGRFRLDVPVEGMDLRRARRLSFAYRMTPDVRVNLYAEIGGRQGFIHLTGPRESDENLALFGEIPIVADGEWHRAEIDLGRALLSWRPLDRRLPVKDLHFGIERGQYLLAGLGGNPGGASYWIDDFEIVSEGPAEFQAKLVDPTGKAMQKGSFTIASEEESATPAEQPFSRGRIEARLKDGRALIAARPAAEGDRSATLRILTVPSPPRVVSVSPAPGGRWGGQPVGIQFGPGGLLPLWNLSLTVNGASFVPDGQKLVRDPTTRILTFDPRAAETVLSEGDPCRFALRLGAESSAPIKEWQLIYSRSADLVPPPRVVLDEYLVYDTFERDLGAWTRVGRDKQGREHGALLVRDSKRAASGRYSLKLFNQLVGGIAGARITTKAIHAGRYPIVSFDCLMDEEVLTDLLVTARGMACRLTLTDNGHRNTAYPLGRLTETFKADGTWHHIEANWHDMLARTPYVAGMFNLTGLQIGDGGWTGNPEGAAYWIDNFSIAPCESSAGEGFELAWTNPDPGRTSAYSYRWSPDPATNADENVDGEQTNARFANLAEGRNYFHIRARDAAGNWGETSHWRFLIDNTPPILADVFPQGDAKSASPTIRVRLTDPLSGLDPAGLRLAVGTRRFAPGQKGVRVDLAAGTLEVDWVAAGLFTTPPPAGHVFEVVLSPPRDFAGNAGQEAKWKWTFAPSADRRPPPAPEVTRAGDGVLRYLSFEEPGAALSASAPVWLDRVLDAERGSYVQRVRVGGAGIRVRVAFPGKVDANMYPYLSFRYRFPPNLKIDLSGYLNDPDPEKRRMVVKLTDAEVRPDYVTLAGRVDGIRLDDAWHVAVIDLKKHIAMREHLKKGEKPTDWTLASLALADVGFNWQAPGTTFYLDDVSVARAGPPKARFRLKAKDETGITGYACSFDREADTVPEEKVNVKPGQTYDVAFPDKGIWFVHASARDGAGNWSKPGHTVYVVE